MDSICDRKEGGTIPRSSTYYFTMYWMLSLKMRPCRDRKNVSFICNCSKCGIKSHAVRYLEVQVYKVSIRVRYAISSVMSSYLPNIVCTIASLITSINDKSFSLNLCCINVNPWRSNSASRILKSSNVMSARGMYKLKLRDGSIYSLTKSVGK